MKKRGFTLIELLAVIIILAIIALIATPIVMRVIENSRKGASERSAENYVKAVETTIVTERMNGNIIEDGIYILNNGDICLNNECNKTLVVTMTGTKPSSGKVKIENEKVTAHILTIGDYEEKYGSFPRLPYEYQEVEYLESTGTQYINTGLIPNNNINFKVEVDFFRGAYANGAVIGAWGSNYFGLSGNYWAYGNLADIEVSGLATYANVGPKLFKNNVQIATSNNENMNITNNIVLFALTYGDNNLGFYSQCKIYYCEIYSGEYPIRNFIPCYRKSDNKPGMYDLVNNIFYTNQGDGEFEIGDEV